MPVPSAIGDLSIIAANNSPPGTEAPTSTDDYLRAHAAFIAQVRDSNTLAGKLIGSVSGTNTITGTLTPAITAYAAGQSFRFVVAATNTGAVTINLNGLGAKAITKAGSTALAAGDLKAGALVTINYDGTRFQTSYTAQVLPAASTTVAGLVELATDAETIAGSDAARGVTPAGLAALTASATRKGLVELATPAEALAGTDSTRAVTPEGLAVLPFTKEWTSTDQAITAGGLLTISHSLGVAPKAVHAFLVCQTDQAGYSSGDIVPCALHNTDGAASYGPGIVISSTNIRIRFGVSGGGFVLTNFDTGVLANITAANWKLRLKAFA